jgi:DNA-binding NarL/FixJ family response regulator
MSESPIRVLVVDDHEVVQWGFRLLLSKQAWIGECAAARSGAEALEYVESNEVDVALVDLFLGDESGAELCERLRRVSPSTQVLLISGAGEISPQAARGAGASGFVSKDWKAADVAMAVRMVAKGMTVFSPGSEPDRPPLTVREREVLEELATGATNREVADHLHLSPHTVKEYTSSLYKKLGVRNRAEAARRAEELRTAQPRGGR